MLQRQPERPVSYAIQATRLETLKGLRDSLVDILELFTKTHVNRESCLEDVKWMDSFIVEAGKNGFTILGHGHFAAAFYHEQQPNFVIKLGFKKEDSGAAYAAYCRHNKGAVGLPYIYDIGHHSVCYSVIMPRYRKYKFIYSGQGVATDSLYHQYKECQNIIQWGTTIDIYAKYPIVETAWDIRKYFDGIARFDLHHGNVMVGWGNELIITDPVSYTKEQNEEPKGVEKHLVKLKERRAINPQGEGFVDYMARLREQEQVMRVKMLLDKEITSIERRLAWL